MHRQALRFGQRALAIREKTLGPAHPTTARALNNLGHVHASMGQHDLALQTLGRSLAIREKSLGPDHPETASSLNNLASVHRTLGQHALALPYQQRAVAVYQKNVGPDHPSTALPCAPSSALCFLSFSSCMAMDFFIVAFSA